jgi:hypothetical protein
MAVRCRLAVEHPRVLPRRERLRHANPAASTRVRVSATSRPWRCWPSWPSATACRCSKPWRSFPCRDPQGQDAGRGRAGHGSGLDGVVSDSRRRPGASRGHRAPDRARVRVLGCDAGERIGNPSHPERPGWPETGGRGWNASSAPNSGTDGRRARCRRARSEVLRRASAGQRVAGRRREGAPFPARERRCRRPGRMPGPRPWTAAPLAHRTRRIG